MTIIARLDRYLNEQNIHYQTVSHSHSNSSWQSAKTANILPMNLAKGVILEDHEGKHLMAVLPANAKLSLSVLNEEMKATYHFVKEQQVYKLFDDCEHGAVPPVGNIYHMTSVCEQSLTELDHVYLEAGDHETLIKLDREAFRKLMNNSKCLRFGTPVFH
ncbi:aminoacyl-tRNA deacylase [Vibrio salinus]|uniref:aminoacyl-tRNA deacylase n=1 Tax=Vibrio salinus TaxID=2899784 RepID=UPI001E48C7E9|nr:YbaK/EbsC family protein [Vibrio salinus]MCE0494703.1 YbaK/EbsC family protein [Vibrio salinus]